MVKPTTEYQEPALERHETENRFGSFLMSGNASIDVRKSFENYAESQGFVLTYRGDCEQTMLDDNARDLLQIFFDWISNSSICHAEPSAMSVCAELPLLKQSQMNGSGSHSLPSFALSVEGDGFGISPGNLARVFFRFCSAEKQRINRAKLSSGFVFSKATLDLKGARICVESGRSSDGRIRARFDLALFATDIPHSNEYFPEDSMPPGQSDIIIENVLLEDFDHGSNSDQGNTSSISDDKFLSKLMSLLECHISDPNFNVGKLVSEIGMSRPVLFRKAKVLTGSSIINLIRSRRLKMAAMLLKQKKAAVSEVAFQVGYSDPKYFSKSFRSEYGKTPKEYVHSLGA